MVGLVDGGLGDFDFEETDAVELVETEGLEEEELVDVVAGDLLRGEFVLEALDLVFELGLRGFAGDFEAEGVDVLRPVGELEGLGDPVGEEALEPGEGDGACVVQGVVDEEVEGAVEPEVGEVEEVVVVRDVVEDLVDEQAESHGVALVVLLLLQVGQVEVLDQVEVAELGEEQLGDELHD